MGVTAFSITGRSHGAERQFSTVAAGSVDASVLLEDPRVTLYSIDAAAKKAVFVETPEEADVLSAASLTLAQFKTATRLFEVPWETLHRVADRMVEPSQTIMLYHSGRAGSTLLCSLLRTHDQVVAISSPDVFFQLAYVHEQKQLGSAELERLVRSAARMQWKKGRKAAATTFVIKPRTAATAISDIVTRVLPPGSQNWYMYRNCEAVARSRKILLEARIGNLDIAADLRRVPLLAPKLTADFVTGAMARFGPLSHCPLWWSACALKYLELRGLNLETRAIQYAEVVKSPVRSADILFSILRLPFTPDLPSRVEKVMSVDSQAGTPLASTRGAGELSDEEKQGIRDLLAEIPELRTPGVVLPGTIL